MQQNNPFNVIIFIVAGKNIIISLINYQKQLYVLNITEVINYSL
jgi:hypothetical protein